MHQTRYTVAIMYRFPLPIRVWAAIRVYGLPLYAYGTAHTCMGIVPIRASMGKITHSKEQGRTDLMMELYSLIVLLIAVLQHSRACAPNCASVTVTRNRVVNKIIDRVVVGGVEEAQWRGMCHSLCINVS